MVVVLLCADSHQVDIVNTRVRGLLADTDVLCRKAVARISTANITPATPPPGRPENIFQTLGPRESPFMDPPGRGRI